MTESEVKQITASLCETLKATLRRTSDLESAVFALIDTLKQIDPRLVKMYETRYVRPGRAIADEQSRRDQLQIEQLDALILRLRDQ